MPAQHQFFATTPKAMEALLAGELTQLGATDVKAERAGVSFSGTLETAYRVCLWSRVATRILFPIARFEARTPDELYEGIKAIDWSDHLAPSGTLAVDFASSRSAITHTHFGALKVKDAIVDQFRERSGARPSVDLTRPDLRVNVYLQQDRATVGIDLSGDSLHRRGYRVETVKAAMKENLAAAILLLADWPERAKQGVPFMDPMCGSGTLPIEAGLIAADVAPGLGRESFGFERWPQHDAQTWNRLLEEARGRDQRATGRFPPIQGFDADPAAVRAALKNVERAGLAGIVHIERRELRDARPVQTKYEVKADTAGLFVVNPPYGERLGEKRAVEPLYADIGDVLKQRFKGWTGCVFTGNLDLAKSVRLSPSRRHVLYNGAIECRLLVYPIHREDRPVDTEHRREAGEKAEAPKRRFASPGAEMFANRLRKNFKHLSKWAAREGITCYRVYDADLPEYAVAVDLYDKYVHVQEYAPPKTVDPRMAEARLKDVMTLVPEVLGVLRSDVVLKVRARQKEGSQYEKVGQLHQFIEVTEGGHRFLVNLRDYLDTGLFLDHRETRKLIQQLAKGRRFLNLFAYTGTATVYAAMGGAASTTTVDMSNTYLDWAERNFRLNGIRGSRHRLVRADCLKWIPEQNERYGLIFLDVPTFSKSKRMEDVFDVQRDHVQLLRDTARLLEKDGVLIFSNNFRRFRMDAASLPELKIEEITQKTLPLDFKGNPKIHNCWRITRA